MSDLDQVMRDRVEALKAAKRQWLGDGTFIDDLTTNERAAICRQLLGAQREIGQPVCPTCGRWPSLRMGIGTKRTDVDCPDPIHNLADQAPQLVLERDRALSRAADYELLLRFALRAGCRLSYDPCGKFWRADCDRWPFKGEIRLNVGPDALPLIERVEDREAIREEGLSRDPQKL